MYGFKINDPQVFFPQVYRTEVNYCPSLDLSADETKDTFQEFQTKGKVLGYWSRSLLKTRLKSQSPTLTT